jgi:hypothetical protein
MAKACDLAYFVGLSGLTSRPFYEDVGFTDTPQMFTANIINSALVGTTETEVVLAFRGTLPIDTDDWDDFVESIRDWVNDGEANLVEAEYTVGLVHQGFNHSLDLLWDDVLAAVEAQHAATKLPVVVTGHSKGGALASLAAMRLQKDAAITPDVYTFGSPRAGNTLFAKDYNSKILDSWRFENKDDLVPHLPPIVLLLDFLAKADSRLAGLSAHDYHHVGLLEFLNWSGPIVQGSSLALDAQRLTHLAELAAANQIKQVAIDHSLEKQYIPRLSS